MPAFRLALLALIALAAPGFAADPPFDGKALSGTLRPMLLAALPEPLMVAPMTWGTQREVVIGMKWERKGILPLAPVPMKGVRNDGAWQKVELHAVDAAKSLSLDIRNVRAGPDGKTLFDATVGLDVRAVYEQQVWTMGKRVYAGETRGRCRAVLNLACEATGSTTFAPGSLLPTVTLRVRATEAKLGYHNLVVEHLQGVNGKPAELLGKALHAVMTAAKPTFEAEMLAKANAAVVKAADTKDVKLGFDKLLSATAPSKSGK